jgi:cytochrome b561
MDYFCRIMFNRLIFSNRLQPTIDKTPINPTHEIAGWTIIVAISLHIAGAIKHHFIDKDNTLRRMLGKN